MITLNLKATNEYGEYDPAALALYGLQMIVEPYRETTLTSTGSGSTGIFHWRIVEADASGHPLSDTPPVLDAQGSHEVVVTLTAPGAVFLLTVQEHRPDGSLIAEGKVKISCKRVRREIRDLKSAEREEYMDALETVYRVSTKEGQAKYGEGYIGVEHITAYHNSKVSGCVSLQKESMLCFSLILGGLGCRVCEMTKILNRSGNRYLELHRSLLDSRFYTSFNIGSCPNFQLPCIKLILTHPQPTQHYCYHSGLQFLPAHIAFDRVMEKSIQLINPKVSMPLWDFMIDAAVYGYK